MSRISKNQIFKDPSKYWDISFDHRIYISQNLSEFIGDYVLKNESIVDRLHKFADEIGFEDYRYCIAGHDLSTYLVQIIDQHITVQVFKDQYETPDIIASFKGSERIAIKKTLEKNDPIVLLGFRIFFFFLIFIDFEKITLKPKHKHKPSRYQPVKNDTNKDFILADIHWNREWELTTGFAVSGHFRLQPYGEGRKKAKLIYIKPFKKDGYSRKSGKSRI